MHQVTRRVLLSALVLLTGATTVLFFKGPVWCFLLLIVITLRLIIVASVKPLKLPAHAAPFDENGEIGHANLPPEFDR